MSDKRLGVAALVGAALVVGFFVGGWRAGTHIETGSAHSKGDGGGTIVTTGWSYGFSSDVAWTDVNNSYHEGGLPDCLPPLSSVEGIRFAWVEVTVEGSTWRSVVWIDCRSVPTETSAGSGVQPAPTASNP